MLSIYYATKRLTDIDARLNKLEAELAGLPKGRLNHSICHGKPRFYQVIGSRGSSNYSKKYLSAMDHNITIGLAKKKLIIDEIHELEQERKFLERLVKDQERERSRLSAKKNSTAMEPLLNLLRENSTLSENIFTWSNEPYSSSAPNKDSRRVRAIDGTMVRSKSEAEIIMILVKYGIPYRYECDLYSNDRIIGCPDFTIMHPSTHEIFIWEHFGLLDDTSYVRRNIYKVQKYIEAGFYPMVNFIVTSETYSKPFDITLADSLIQQFFLQ